MSQELKPTPIPSAVLARFARLPLEQQLATVFAKFDLPTNVRNALRLAVELVGSDPALAVGIVRSLKAMGKPHPAIATLLDTIEARTKRHVIEPQRWSA